MQKWDQTEQNKQLENVFVQKFCSILLFFLNFDIINLSISMATCLYSINLLIFLLAPMPYFVGLSHGNFQAMCEKNDEKI